MIKKINLLYQSVKSKYITVSIRVCDLLRLSPQISFKQRLSKNTKQFNILVLGIALFDRTNHYYHIRKRLRSNVHNIRQRWAILKSSETVRETNNIKNIYLNEYMQRSRLLNQLLAQEEISKYDFVIIVDDDIRLESNFIDKFIGAQDNYDFALAQPARTENSVISHEITTRQSHLIARETNFVEIGPLVSIRRDAVKIILPLDEEFPMGWGLDYIWPIKLSKSNLKLGIIDAFPVAHTLRSTGSSYSPNDVDREMKDLLIRKYPDATYEKLTIQDFYY